MVGHLRRADGAEEDGVELPQLGEAALGNVGARAEVALRAPVEGLELQAEAVREALEHLDAGGDDFGADPVDRDRRDAVSLQAACLERDLAASATAAPTSEVLALPFMSGVCVPETISSSMARTTSAEAPGWPRCSSISLPDQMAAFGLA